MIKLFGGKLDLSLDRRGIVKIFLMIISLPLFIAAWWLAASYLCLLYTSDAADD